MKNRILQLSIWFLVVALNVGCDQVSKTIVRQKIGATEQISIIKGHFTLLKVENTGAFLSAGDGLPEAVRFTFLSILPLLILGYGLYYLFVKTNLPKGLQLGLSFLIGGGIGNIYDRIRYGSVTDFMHIDFGLFRTGIFNLADISIMTGAILMFFYTFIKKPALANVEN